MTSFILAHFWTVLLILGTIFVPKYRWIGIILCILNIIFRGTVPGWILWIFGIVVVSILLYMKEG